MIKTDVVTCGLFNGATGHTNFSRTSPMIPVSAKKRDVMDHMDRMAVDRDKYLKRNYYYYEDLIKMLKYNIPEGA